MRTSGMSISGVPDACRYCNCTTGVKQCDTCRDHCCANCLFTKKDMDLSSFDTVQEDKTGYTDYNYSKRTRTIITHHCERCFSLDVQLFCYRCGSETMQNSLLRCHNRGCRQAVHYFCLELNDSKSWWICEICKTTSLQFQSHRVPAIYFFKDLDTINPKPSYNTIPFNSIGTVSGSSNITYHQKMPSTPPYSIGEFRRHSFLSDRREKPRDLTVNLLYPTQLTYFCSHLDNVSCETHQSCNISNTEVSSSNTKKTSRNAFMQLNACSNITSITPEKYAVVNPVNERPCLEEETPLCYENEIIIVCDEEIDDALKNESLDVLSLANQNETRPAHLKENLAMRKNGRHYPQSYYTPYTNLTEEEETINPEVIFLTPSSDPEEVVIDSNDNHQIKATVLINRIDDDKGNPLSYITNNLSTTHDTTKPVNGRNQCLHNEDYVLEFSGYPINTDSPTDIVFDTKDKQTKVPLVYPETIHNYTGKTLELPNTLSSNILLKNQIVTGKDLTTIPFESKTYLYPEKEYTTLQNKNMERSCPNVQTSVQMIKFNTDNNRHEIMPEQHINIFKWICFIHHQRRKAQETTKALKLWELSQQKNKSCILSYKQKKKHDHFNKSGKIGFKSKYSFRPSHHGISSYQSKCSTPCGKRSLLLLAVDVPLSPNRNYNKKNCRNKVLNKTRSKFFSETADSYTCALPKLPQRLQLCLETIRWGSLFATLWPFVNQAYMESLSEFRLSSYASSMDINAILATPRNTLISGSRWQKLYRKAIKLPCIENMPHYIKQLLNLLDRLAELIDDGSIPHFEAVESFSDLEQLHNKFKLWPPHIHKKSQHGFTDLCIGLLHSKTMLAQFQAVLNYRQYIFINKSIYDGYLNDDVDNPHDAKVDSLTDPCSVLSLKLHCAFSQFGFYTPVAFCESEKFGVFLKAVCSIPRKTILAEYCGKIEPQHFNLTKLSNYSNSIFDLWNTGISDTSLCLNPEPYTNIARFLSHGNGNTVNVLSCTLNVNQKVRIFLVSRRQIEAGDTLFINYNAGTCGEYPTDAFSDIADDLPDIPPISYS